MPGGRDYGGALGGWQRKGWGMGGMEMGGVGRKEWREGKETRQWVKKVISQGIKGLEDNVSG